MYNQEKGNQMTYRDLIEKILSRGEEILDKEVAIVAPIEYDEQDGCYSHDVLSLSEFSVVNHSLERLTARKTNFIVEGDIVLMSHKTF